VERVRFLALEGGEGGIRPVFPPLSVGCLPAFEERPEGAVEQAGDGVGEVFLLPAEAPDRVTPEKGSRLAEEAMERFQALGEDLTFGNVR
jgi:hypothetical protein